MTASVSDDVVGLFAAIGTHKEIAKTIEKRFGGLPRRLDSRQHRLRRLLGCSDWTFSRPFINCRCGSPATKPHGDPGIFL